MQEAEKIWMNGALVDWAGRPGARALARPALRHHRVRGHPLLRRGQGHGGLPARRPPGAARALGGDVPHAAARTRARSCARAVHQVISANGLGGLLHPADRPARLRHDGPVPARGAGGRRRRGVASGAPTSARTACARASAPRSPAGAASARPRSPRRPRPAASTSTRSSPRSRRHKAGYQEAHPPERGRLRGRRLGGEPLPRARRRPHHARRSRPRSSRASPAPASSRWPQDEGIPVLEREVARGELYTADEVFITGTAAEVCPINEVDDHAAGRPRADHASACRTASSPPRRAATRSRPRGWTTWAPPRRRCHRDARERARRHLRHHPARRHAARGAEPVRGRAARRGRAPGRVRRRVPGGRLPGQQPQVRRALRPARARGPGRRPASPPSA